VALVALALAIGTWQLMQRRLAQAGRAETNLAYSLQPGGLAADPSCAWFHVGGQPATGGLAAAGLE